MAPTPRGRKPSGPTSRGRLSILFYAVGVALAFLRLWVGIALYPSMAINRLIPDRRIEKNLSE